MMPGFIHLYGWKWGMGMEIGTDIPIVGRQFKALCMVFRLCLVPGDHFHASVLAGQRRVEPSGRPVVAGRRLVAPPLPVHL